jgi:hypothetical protein
MELRANCFYGDRVIGLSDELGYGSYRYTILPFQTREYPE